MSGPSFAADTDASALAHCIAIHYPLPPQSAQTVSLGQHLERGDVLARAHWPGVLVAFASELSATPGDVMSTMPVLGTVVQAGARLAQVRRGLRTHTTRAPVSGIIASNHPSGVMTIAPNDGTVDVRARYGGFVLESHDSFVVVATPAIRIPFAYGVNTTVRDASLQVTSALLDRALTSRTAVSSLGPEASLVTAHIADLNALGHGRQHGGALLIVGTVTEAVAWELCTTANGTATQLRDAATVVLAGPGDVDAGVRAVAPLRTANGMTAIIDRESRALLLLDEREMASNALEASRAATAISFHEPAYWNESGTILSTETEYALESGLRVLAVEVASARRGTARTPIQNFGKSV